MRKMFAVVLTVVCILAMSISVAAAEVTPRGGGRGFRGGADAPNAPRHGMQQSGGIGLWGAVSNFFWDEDGNFLDRETVETNLDNAVANDEITAAERDLLLERYDFCATSGGGAIGVRRGRGGGRGICPWLN